MLFKKEVFRHYLKQGLQKRWPFFSLQAHHSVSGGRSLLVLKQIEQVGTLLFQNSSLTPERVELISPEVTECKELYDYFASMTDGKRVYSFSRSYFGMISSDYLAAQLHAFRVWKIEEREGHSLLSNWLQFF